MPASLRNRLIAVGASLLALVFGWQVASGDLALGFLVMGVLALITVEWLSRVRPEALLLGFLLRKPGGFATELVMPFAQLTGLFLQLAAGTLQ